MILFCPRHRAGYNDDLDAVCPQCTLASLDAPAPWLIDTDTLDVKVPAGAADKRPINVKSRK